jgi:hypothetical protein
VISRPVIENYMAVVLDPGRLSGGDDYVSTVRLRIDWDDQLPRQASTIATDDKAGASDDAATQPTPTRDLYSDAAYGAREFLEHLTNRGIASRRETQPPTAAAGMFTKSDFDISLDAEPRGTNAPAVAEPAKHVASPPRWQRAHVLRPSCLC